MNLRRDRRSIVDQTKSGLKIAGAMVSTLTICFAFAYGYDAVSQANGTGHVIRGWVVMGGVTAVTLLTVQYWRLWFFYIPGFLGMRTAIGLFLGWFSPRGYVWVIFPALMLGMAMLSYRFSRLSKIRATDRVVLILAVCSLASSVSKFFGPQPSATSLLFAGVGVAVLLLSRIVSAQNSRSRHRPVSVVANR